MIHNGVTYVYEQHRIHNWWPACVAFSIRGIEVDGSVDW